MTYYVLTSRERLIGCLPEGAVGAEVGVFAGDFAATMLTAAKPSELHLIDAWRFVGYDWRELPDHVPESQHAAFVRYLKNVEPAWNTEDPSDGLAILYDRVRQRFADDPRVRIARGLSSEVLATYPDAFFDFVYIDADHDYHSVLSDLWLASRKLKAGGLLLGHDFDMDRQNNRSNHNVIEAVMNFCKNSRRKILAITADLGSTFAISDDNASALSAHFLNRVIDLRTPIVEIPQEILWNHRRILIQGTDSQARMISSFCV